jgi:hypothetical protein
MDSRCTTAPDERTMLLADASVGCLGGAQGELRTHPFAPYLAALAVHRESRNPRPSCQRPSCRSSARPFEDIAAPPLITSRGALNGSTSDSSPSRIA